MANPLLTAVTFEYPSSAVEEVTQNNFRQFFKGSEMVVAGKLRAQSPEVLSAKVRGQLVSVANHPGGEGWLQQAFRGTRFKLQPCQTLADWPWASYKVPPATIDDLSPHCMGWWWGFNEIMS